MTGKSVLAAKELLENIVNIKPHSSEDVAKVRSSEDIL
jgi:hypothetical protein